MAGNDVVERREQDQEQDREQKQKRDSVLEEFESYEEGSEEQKAFIRRRASVVYKEETRKNQRRFGKLLTLAYSSTKAAALMLVAAIAALIIANTPAMEYFEQFLEFDIGFVFGGTAVSMPIAEIINDIFMAVFFLLVGLEIKYEMTAGELTDLRQAMLPIIAAFGGVLAPIVIYTVFNISNPESAHGWGVPTATDIAFALGILALLGNRVPNGVRVFLSTLAVADDIIAIVVIAVFYGQTPSLFWLACAACVMVVLFIMNRLHIYAIAPYLLVGVVLWYCVFMSGVHSTIAGVLLAFTIPSTSRVAVSKFVKWSGDTVQFVGERYDDDTPVSTQGSYLETAAVISKVARQTIPPATRLERKLYPWVYFGILPLFALTNADVSFVGGDLGAMIVSPVFLGVFFGLLLGKPIGIMLFSFIVIKTKLASLPENVNWIHMLGAAILGGVGFTMAIFVANLAFPAHPELITNAKVAILSASTLAGVIGFVFLMLQAKAAQARGVTYLTTNSPDATRQTAGAEAARQSNEVLDGIESPLVRQEIEQAQKDKASHTAEVVVELGPEDEDEGEDR